MKYEYVSKTKWDKGKHYVLGEKESRYGTRVTPEIDNAIKREADRALRAYGWELNTPHTTKDDL